MFKNIFRIIRNFIKHGFQFRNMYYWDGSYIYQALNIILSNYIKEFENVTEWAYVGMEQDIRRKMKVCKALCERILKDDYYSPYKEKSEKQLKEWWDGATVTDLPDGGCIMTFLDRKGFDYPKEHMKAEQRMRKQDEALLFNLLNKNIQRWWW